MPKKAQRQYTNRMEDDYVREIPDKRLSNSKRDTVLNGDTAKALVEAGANMANQQDQEILAMLKQINEQLKQMQSQSSGQDGPQQSDRQQTSGQGKQNQKEDRQNSSQQHTRQLQQKEALVTEELNQLFSQLLKSKQGQQSQSQMSSQSQGQTLGQQDQGQQETEAQNQCQKNKSGAIAVQTAAQVLAEAQYELANELDASLKKLKQVITESEKIANKISNLLGEGNTTNKQ